MLKQLSRLCVKSGLSIKAFIEHMVVTNHLQDMTYQVKPIVISSACSRLQRNKPYKNP